MSTVLIAGSPGSTVESVAQNVGAGGSLQGSNVVELQVTMATTAVNDGSSTRQVQREEVLILLNIFSQVIVGYMNWPYAAS